MSLQKGRKRYAKADLLHPDPYLFKTDSGVSLHSDGFSAGPGGLFLLLLPVVAAGGRHRQQPDQRQLYYGRAGQRDQDPPLRRPQRDEQHHPEKFRYLPEGHLPGRPVPPERHDGGNLLSGKQLPPPGEPVALQQRRGPVHHPPRRLSPGGVPGQADAGGAPGRGLPVRGAG